MFSGIGGFELGIHRAVERVSSARKIDPSDNITNLEGRDEIRRHRTTCIGFSEIDKYAVSIYQQHFPGHKNYGNATKINAAELPYFDILVGGFPCQAFSIAGKRKGFDDTRGTLFYDIARILSNKRPKHFLLENVKGLLSHDDGKTFQTIIGVLTSLGYCVEWQVLNSKNFGVPQNRERVFIVGHLGESGGRKVFPIYQNNGADIELPTLTSRYWGGQANGGYLHEITPPGTSQGYRVYDSDGLAVTQASQAGGVGAKTGLYAIPVLTPDRPEKRQNGRRMKEDGEPRHGVLDGYRIRRLTLTECERLQGFPDGWTEGISDSQRYKCIGNAVTVNVIQAIFERIL
jgi:DNA (cytosine-5)-methyltransferase 1